MIDLKRVSALIAASCLGCSMIASADTVSEKFTAMDADASGLVSPPEFVAYATSDGQKTAEEAQRKFFELAGSDGMLSLEELESAYAAKDQPKEAHSAGGGS